MPSSSRVIRNGDFFTVYVFDDELLAPVDDFAAVAAASAFAGVVSAALGFFASAAFASAGLAAGLGLAGSVALGFAGSAAALGFAGSVDLFGFGGSPFTIEVRLQATVTSTSS